MLPRWFSIPLLTLLLAILAGELGYMAWRHYQPRENPYDPVIAAAAREYRVDPFLIRALIWRESQFRPLTLGLAQEHGLMQIRPVVGYEWAKATKTAGFKDDDLFDPTENIRVGTWYLGRAIHRWRDSDDPATFALAEYNAGRSNALKWVDPVNPQSHAAFLQRITYPSTRKYVETILAKRDQYRSALAKDRWYRDFSSPNPAVTDSP